jgi:hypothetical protein
MSNQKRISELTAQAEITRQMINEVAIEIAAASALGEMKVLLDLTEKLNKLVGIIRLP